MSIVIKSLNKGYGFNLLFPRRSPSHFILENVNCRFEKGEKIGIIGNNGSGKSTLLKILAGVTLPSRGAVDISGNVVPFLELGAGFRMDLDAFQNIMLNGTLLGVPRKQLRENSSAILEFAGLTEVGTSPLGHFSSGMRMRLAFSIGMFAKGDIYIFDEVFAVGDASFTKKCKKSLSTLAESEAIIFVCSHDMRLIEEYCDRALCVDDHSIAFDGSSADCVKFYKDVILNA